MRTAIVTGANGFIGSAVVKELVRQGIYVIAVVRSETSNLNDIIDLTNISVVICPLDKIESLPLLVSEHKIDIFFHFAWAGSRLQEERMNPQIQLDNIKGTLDCIKVCSDLKCSRFVGTGSITENESNRILGKCDIRPNLSFLYGGAKRASYAMSIPLASSLGIDLIWGKITNTYGIGEKSQRLINSTLYNCIHKIPCNFSSGTQIYDFIYIDDVAKAFVGIGKNGIPFSEYVIGSGNPRKLKEFLTELQSKIAPHHQFNFGSKPFTGVSLCVDDFNTKSLSTDIGFVPEISFADGCTKTFQWMKLSEEWMSSSKEGVT